MHRLGQPDNHGEKTQRQTQENDWGAEKELIRYYKKITEGIINPKGNYQSF